MHADVLNSKGQSAQWHLYKTSLRPSAKIFFRALHSRKIERSGFSTPLFVCSVLSTIFLHSMTMAFVTRCPYCGAVWRLPNRDTAEQGPVRCSDCQHSFDATCNLLELPEECLPKVSASAASSAKPETIASAQTIEATDTPESDPNAANEKHIGADSSPQAVIVNASRTTDAKPIVDASQAVPTSQSKRSGSPVEPPAVNVSEPTNQDIKPTPPQGTVPQSQASSDKTEQLQRLHNMTPGEELRASKPDPTLSKIIPAKSKPQASQPRKVRVPENITSHTHQTKPHQGAFASVFTACVLLLILASALAVIFNQKIMALFPQTTPLFHNVCGTIPCPGFYLSDISAFVVSKTNLRAVDESGNYQLEITLINGSDMPQAIPALDIELVDDSDTTLMHKTLMPTEYLNNPPPASIAADRSITVRFSMQTNVTPARCIVNPVYPK